MVVLDEGTIRQVLVVDEVFGEEATLRRVGGLDSSARLAGDLRSLAVLVESGTKASLRVPIFDDVSAVLIPEIVDDVSDFTAASAGAVELSDGRTGWYASGVMEDAVTIKISLDGTGGADSDSLIRVHTAGGQGNLLVAELDPDGIVNRPHSPVDAASTSEAVENVAFQLGSPVSAFAATGGPGSPKIDLLVSYDAGAIHEIKDRMGISWGAARHEFMSLSMTDTAAMNLALQNSNVSARIKVLGYYQSTLDFVGTSILDALPVLRNPSDGVLDDVAAERDRLGADLVIFFSNEPGAGASTGFVPGDTNAAYAAVDAGCFFDCFLTYAHELGHNFGNGHDRLLTNDGSGFSSYSRARVDPVAKLGTVNSGFDPNTNCLNCVRILYYSNPSVSFGPSGWVTGTTIDDNARTMRDQMFTLAGYRTAQTSFVGLASVTTNTSKLWTVTDLGDIIAIGGAPFHGDPSTGGLIGSVVAVEDNNPWGGYWVVSDAGQVKAYGAVHYGDPSNINLAQPVVAATNRNNSGYWLVAKDGGVFAYGSAAYYGSIPGLGISVTNIVDIVVRPQGNGYWMLGKDGGVFSFGAAPFYGSLPGIGLTVGDAVSIEVNKAGTGYWIVRSNGTVYSFGSAPFRGSKTSSLIVDMARYGSGNNYRLLRSDGSIAECSGSCLWL